MQRESEYMRCNNEYIFLLGSAWSKNLIIKERTKIRDIKKQKDIRIENRFSYRF